MLDSTVHNKNVCLLGYTNKMNDILASIDVLISKPGGLTTTEALLNRCTYDCTIFYSWTRRRKSRLLN